MKKIKYIILFPLFLISIIVNAQINYPKTPIEKVINTYHGIEISDNYQWLEDTQSTEVKNWIKLQNKVSEKYLNNLTKSSSSRWMMDKLFYYEMNTDSLEGNFIKNKKLYFKIMYPSINSTPAIYYSKGNYRGYEKLINPNSISKKDQIIFSFLKSSKDGRFLAYQYSRNGSDWKEIKIVQIKNRHYFKETLKNTISSEIYWFGQGFFYKRYPNDTTQEAKNKRKFPQIMYHKLGTKQIQDKLIFDVKRENETLRVYGTSKQNLFVIKKEDASNQKFSYFYLEPNKGLEFKPMFENITYDINIVDYKLDTIIALTKIKNKKYLISFPIQNPKKWKILTPSYAGAVFTDFELTNTKIVTSFQTNNSSIISVSNYNGKVLGEINTPKGMSVSKLVYSKNLNKFFFRLSSYTIPPVLCLLNFDNYTFRYLGKTEVGFDPKKYKFKSIKFSSHDGTEIPLFIVYKDSLKRNKNTPFLLNTYGGYGVIAKPTFNPGVIFFIENGGAFAYVHVRGGGEYGDKWSKAGKKLNKKNSILDFKKAAEYLINEGYTKPKKIAVIGGSHGGLIVAAAIINKPQLFGAAVIDVGVLDMLRFEKSEVGGTYTNISEFGSVKNEAEFKNLLSYSPYQNIDYSVNYPSMLIMTGSDDTRVPPYHSFKFAAKLQHNPSQKAPILLWSQDKTGHYGANEFNAKIKEFATIYNFLFQELKNNN
ncbi:prolyl oligopeptidase family serine peptidase [Lutibacter sp.]